MGHQRLGRLPRTRRWREVVRLLADAPDDTAAIASAVLLAAQRRLDDVADETAVPFCYWLLLRLGWAARDAGFEDRLGAIGVAVVPGESAIGFIARLSEWAADRAARAADSGPFADLAIQSFRRTLLETAGAGERDLFGDTAVALRRAMRQYATQRGFGVLARRFFGDFVAGTLRYFLDREIANRIGPESGLVTVDDARDFAEALDLHAYETARIMQDFAAEWYWLHNYETAGAIDEAEARRFVGHAFRKIRGELMVEARAA